MAKTIPLILASWRLACLIRPSFLSIRNYSAMSPTTIPVHAPWAYESLPSQKAVEDSFIFQIMQSVVL